VTTVFDTIVSECSNHYPLFIAL